MYDTTISGGKCSKCGEYFSNKPRKVNIVIDLRDSKLYCKDCAISTAWETAKRENIIGLAEGGNANTCEVGDITTTTECAK